MKQHILFIHGAGGHDEDKILADALQKALGDSYNVVYPRMPDENEPNSDAWKAKITSELAAFDATPILVGHSLGASTLLKYLSEEKLDQLPAGLFLVAAPYWDANNEDVNEYAVREDFASHIPTSLPIFFYHSKDDEYVPFAHLAQYGDKLPEATVREFDGRGHQFNNDLSEVAADIRSL